jgi:hypothetical protein
MKLDVIIDDKNHRIEVPEAMLHEAEDFFRRMDEDMSHGWQMGPEFVENPNPMQRCQIAANKLLTSHAAENRLVMQLMAAYILKRMPGVQTINIDTAGEMLNTELVFETGARRAAPIAGRMGEAQARAQADQDVSQVYQVGKAWRFAVYDRRAGRWMESPFTDSEDAARRQRDEAHARLLQALLGG